MYNYYSPASTLQDARLFGTGASGKGGQPTEKEQYGWDRLASIDLLRGLTVVLMIFVNNGAGDHIFPLLEHSKWNGLTFADLVFPSFLFILGMSTYLSLRKHKMQWSRGVATKILSRSAQLFIIGLAINWFDMAMDGRPLDLAHLRLWGVMQRLALCYLFTAALALSCRRYFIPFIVVGLAAYAALLYLGGGYVYDASANVLARVDRALFGLSHLYQKSPVDPEGLVSTFSSLLHTMTGFVVMDHLLDRTTIKARMAYLAPLGSMLLIVGYALMPWLPLNKRVWSPTYVFVTIGIVVVTLIFMLLTVDRKKKQTRRHHNRLYNALLACGTNPLAIYVGSEILSIVAGATGVKDEAYRALHAVIPSASWAGFAYASLFTALFVALALVLYKHKIFIKL